jgi:hypothetical protein
MTMAATLPVNSKVAVMVARSVGKREGAHPIKEAEGDATTTMTTKACHYKNNNQPTMIGVGE